VHLDAETDFNDEDGLRLPLRISAERRHFALIVP
jgi:hypothetical protein